MRAVYVARPGPQGRFEVVDHPEPSLVAGEVLVQVEAAGLAFADLLMRYGMYPGTPRTGFIPGYDVVGTVTAVTGAGAPRPGDRVAGLLVRGGLAERVAVRADQLVTVPSSVSAAQAACLPLNYVAAWQMLHRIAGVERGETVLVFGAGGGVGTALCELATRRGCRVIGVASPAKHAVITKLGAIPVTARTPKLGRDLRDLTDGRGADACFDPVGGNQLSVGWQALAADGRLVCYGFADAVFKTRSIARVFLNSQLRMTWWRLTGGRRRISFYSIADRMKRSRDEYLEDLTTLVGRLSDGEINPVVDATLDLEGVPAAYDRLSRGAVIGKIVATMTPNV